MSDLRPLCKSVIEQPLFAPQWTPEDAESVLRLYSRIDRMKYESYRRVSLAWHIAEGEWFAHHPQGVEMWYRVHPGAGGAYWLYGGFPTLSEAKRFAGWHVNALADPEDTVITDSVLFSS